MYSGNVRFLIIMGCILLSAIFTIIRCWRYKTEYRKVLEKIKKGGEEEDGKIKG